MPTVVAALIAAAVALLVTVVERRWVARDERRRWELVDKRQVYARFLGAISDPGLIWELWSDDHKESLRKSGIDPNRAVMTMATAWAEVELTAENEVFLAALALTGRMRSPEKLQGEEFQQLRSRFTEAARRELGRQPLTYTESS